MHALDGEHGLIDVTLDATVNAIPFYESAGYVVCQYCDDQENSCVAVPYARMRKRVRATAPKCL
jgi:hypothetical protein